MQLTPDLDQTRQFLAALDQETETFTFQVFADAEGSGVRPVHRHGRFDALADWLTAQNQAGAGVFVMVNEGDGKGRKTENVIRVRAGFVDLDGAPLEPVLAGPLPPELVVESSPGKWHAYWRLADCPLEKFSAVQSALAKKYGGDEAVKDLPRIMRLPGFYHQKCDPFMTRITHTHINTSRDLS